MLEKAESYIKWVFFVLASQDALNYKETYSNRRNC